MAKQSATCSTVDGRKTKTEGKKAKFPFIIEAMDPDHVWKASLSQQVLARDALYTLHSAYFPESNKTSGHLIETLDKLSSLQSHYKSLESTHKDLQNLLLSSETQLKNLATTEETSRANNALAELRIELADAYKTNALNSSRIFALMDTNTKNETLIHGFETESRGHKKKIDGLGVKVVDLQYLVEEKDGVIQILRDELCAHQLELIQREEQITKVAEKLRSAEDENRQLVERWVSAQEGVVTRMNEANELVEANLKTRASLGTNNSIMSMFGMKSPEIKQFKEIILEERKIQRSLPPSKAKRIIVVGY